MGRLTRRRRDTPGARARRALLIDLLLATAIAALGLSLAAGLGVVGAFALPVLAIGLLWIVLEHAAAKLGRRRSGRARAAE